MANYWTRAPFESSARRNIIQDLELPVNDTFDWTGRTARGLHIKTSTGVLEAEGLVAIFHWIKVPFQ